MKLTDCIEFGKDCDLETVEECVATVDIHAPSIFSYSEIEKELAELHKEYEEWKENRK